MPDFQAAIERCRRTQEQLAAAAATTQPTVSAALHGPFTAHDRMRDHLERIARALDYTPRPLFVEYTAAEWQRAARWIVNAKLRARREASAA